ncbi:C40 family peptidase [Selenomonas ruminis]|uniref:Endopeptidase n=2 Tax=Selenomonas TaxID=970 RepID=A0A5D6W7A7_9FIRM|nr:C40 family peptidase [Selenomonas sp.]TYZ23877.1 endopeptidase [Selenomonas sp. mPRGC5]
MKRPRLLRTGIVTCLSLVMLTGAVLASPTLRSGSTGHDVLLLQKKLKTVGYTIHSVDGVYGDETERAVAEFQRDQKIRITGIVNNATWRALQKAKKRTWGSNVPKPEPIPVPTTGGGQLAPDNQPILAPGKVNAIIRTAKSYIGVPYKFGGDTPKAFDCSGYLQYVFAQNGITIPRTADEQYKLGRRTTSSRQLVPGDLVFFTTYEPGASHCGIYLGNGQFIHASSSKGVRIDELSNSYWSPRYYGGKHIVK